MNSKDNKNGSTVSAPIEYKLFKYRQKMGITWQELLATPFDVITSDIEMMDIEANMLV